MKLVIVSFMILPQLLQAQESRDRDTAIYYFSPVIVIRLVNGLKSVATTSLEATPLSIFLLQTRTLL